MAAENHEPEPAESAIPSELLEAISYPGGGRVVLVVGAGCSVEAPTQLPLASQLASDCYRKLVADGVLADGACAASEEDLSAVADAVFAARDSQRPLVERFPPDRFRRATPNEGHSLAAALMREGAISNILSLNFDLAQDTALSNVAAKEEVATIDGPDDHHRLIARNLVYLHRSIARDADELILRTVQLEAWQGCWEEVVAQRFIGGSVTVFVGLGSPAGVLLETTLKILGLVPGGARAFLVDPVEMEKSEFFSRLGLGPETYIQLGWIELMRVLAARLVQEHIAALERVAEEMMKENDWTVEDVASACSRLTALGLLGLGCLRASWLVRSEPYMTHPVEPEVHRMLGDLIIGVSMLQRLTGREARFDETGIVEFEDEEGRTASVMVCSGGGHRRWAHVEAIVGHRREQLTGSRRPPRRALVAGVAGGREVVAAPSNITGEPAPRSLISGGDEFAIVTVDEVRSDPSLAARMMA